MGSPDAYAEAAVTVGAIEDGLQYIPSHTEIEKSRTFGSTEASRGT